MAKPILSKRCCDCKTPKPITAFYKNRSTKDGLNCYCRDCWNKRIAAAIKSGKHREYARKTYSKMRRDPEKWAAFLAWQRKRKHDCGDFVVDRGRNIFGDFIFRQEVMVSLRNETRKHKCGHENQFHV
ncbi:MAG: hypothetical protein V4479_10380, partial [Actinomycetota bacterium]